MTTPGGDSQGFAIHLVRCREAHREIDGVITALQTLLGELDTKARPLISAWEGDAQQAYIAKQTSWTKDSDDIVSILVAINKALDESILDYQSAESFGVKMFQGQGG